MSVRAKFICHTKHEYSHGHHGIQMQAVYSNDPKHENKVFSDMTPTGRFEMHIKSTGPHAFFKVGREYYLDFSEAPATA